ncbi:hypothetical protein KKA17_10200, partial [bacterium]|nr:hypothetical protein [bacterium]MBU1883434.1 hypothetical protein [bacterium]
SSLQTSALVYIPNKNSTQIKLHTINTAELKNNISKSVNNSLHAPQRKCPWGVSLHVRQINQIREVA